MTELIKEAADELAITGQFFYIKKIVTWQNSRS
jgi:hypothetical protein